MISVMRLKYAFVGAVGMVSVLVGAAANAATYDGDATVNILQALNIQQTNTLDFGNVVQPSGADQTITVDTSGAVVPAGTTITRAGGATAAGTFSVDGSIGNNVTISVNNLSGGGAGLTLNSVSYRYGSSNGSTVGSTVTPITGEAVGQVLNVGGMLTVASTVSPGAYTPTFTISVDYE